MKKRDITIRSLTAQPRYSVQSFPQQQKLYGLDHLRAAAICYVFLFHYFILSGGEPAWLPGFAAFGWSGVDLFFVLSGYLIASGLFRQIADTGHFSVRDFFIRRVFRIIPAYLATLALYFCVPLFREKEQLPPLWKFLTFTQNFGLDLRHYGTFSHAWSLCVEEHFYLLLPPVLLLLLRLHRFKRAYWLPLLLLFCGIALRHYSYQSCYLPYAAQEDAGVQWYRYVYYPSYNRLDGLLAGVSVAAVWHFVPAVRERLCRYGNLMFVLGIAVLVTAAHVCVDPLSYTASVWGFPLVALGYGCVLLSALSPSSFLYRCRARFTAFIAAISYSIYLTHKGIIHITHQFPGAEDLNPGLLLLISAAVSIAAACVLHVLVERPFMRLRGRMLQR
ncbi:acyltransferase [Rurimicrobium arvi]|uniref:acyltransferase family protein n=1 Tax=Rurimicrobium arvi TaxID=2049916 RepID=UPI0031DFD1A9